MRKTMLYALLIPLFVVFGLLISNWINQNYILALGIPTINNTISLDTSFRPHGFLQNGLKTFTFFSKVIIWTSGLILPIISVFIIFFHFLKKIITK